MELRLSHIALAVPEIAPVLKKLSSLAFENEHTHEVPTERVRAAMLPMVADSELRLEVLEPTSGDSPIAKFLEKRPSGGLHHVCFAVDDLDAWEKKLRAAGLEILPPGIRKAARGRALFLHPKAMGGMLVELEEIARA
jgi:methylmalonyl-CoA/ethylmalonyl-CoA epimerase